MVESVKGEKLPTVKWIGLAMRVIVKNMLHLKAVLIVNQTRQNVFWFLPIKILSKKTVLYLAVNS